MAWNFTVRDISIGSMHWSIRFGPRDHRNEKGHPERQNLNLPRTSENTPVPIVYGRTRVDSSILIWASDLKSKTVDNSNNGTQYINYAVDLLFNVGIPMGAGATFGGSLSGPKLHNVWMGDRKLPSPVLGAIPAAGSNLNYAQGVWQPRFFGGAGNGGGLIGAYRFWGGWTDQQLTDAIGGPGAKRSPIGDALIAQTGSAALVPGYRKQMLVGFYRYPADSSVYDWNETGPDGGGGTAAPIPRPSTGFMLGENANVDGFGFEVSAYGDKVFAMSSPGFDFGGDADPIEVVYDLLTNPWSRLGLDASKIDTASFLAASTTLKSENHGYSRVLYEASDAAAVINDVFAQTDATMYEEPTTGKLVIKLIRAEDTSGIPSFNEDNIVDFPNYATGTFKDLPNEIIVEYTDRAGEYKTGSAIAQSISVASTNGNRRRAVTISYPGCHNAALAGFLAARDLAVLSQPLSRGRVVLNRDAFRLRPGDLFKLTFAEYGLVNLVVRAGRVDIGQLYDNKVIVDFVQDAFSSTYIGEGLSWSLVPPTVPSPLLPRFITEAPRWLAQEALTSGLVVDADAAHLMPLVAPSTNATQYMLKTRVFTAKQVSGSLHNDWLVDIPLTSFPTTFTLVNSYARELEPYDTTTGILVQGVVGDLAATFATLTATHDQIALEGRHLTAIVSASGKHELISFESVTDMGGGQYRLNNVWRGLLDTPPFAHAAGEACYMIGASFIGRRGWQVGRPVSTWLIPRSSIITSSGQDPIDTYVPAGANKPTDGTIAARALAPLPVQDFAVGGDGIQGTTGLPLIAGRFKTITLLEEEFDTYGTFRSRLSTTIKRGDEAQVGGETPTAFNILLYGATVTGTDYDYTNGNNNLLCYVDDVDTVTIAATGALNQCIKINGYGSIDIVVPHMDQLVAGDVRVGKLGVDLGRAFLYGWQPPRVTAFAPSWRNLLGNVRWKHAVSGEPQLWNNYISNSGTSSIVTGTFSIYRSATGNYLASAGTSPFVRGQAAQISKWNPRGLTAVFVAYIKNNVDTNDTGQLTIDARTSIGGLITSASTAATIGPTATWLRQSVSLVLPATTDRIGATLKAVEVAAGGGGAGPDTNFNEPELRIGQFSTTNGLANYSFETGTTASWTNDTNSFVVAAAVASPSPNYAQGGAFAASQIHQDYALPAGYEYGCTAILTSFVGSTVANDTAKVTLQALDVSNNVLATMDTGALQFAGAGLSTWVKKTLFVSCPDGTVNVRVILNATRFSGVAASGAIFDEVALWLVKDHAPRTTKTFDFSAPSVQKTPTNWQEYVLAYSANPIPQYVFGGTDFNGNEVSYTDNLAAPAAKVIGQFGGGVVQLDGYAFTRASGSAVRHAAATGEGRRNIANFKLTDPFTIGVEFRVDEPGFATLAGLVGRMDLTAGWGIHITAGGQLTAILRGAGATSKTVSTGRVCTEGGYRRGYLVNDPVAQLLWIYDETGGVSVSTAAGLGAIDRLASTCHLRIGRDADDHDTLPGQISRVLIWNVALTAGQIALHHTYGKDPSGLITTYTRTAAAYAFGPNDSTNNVTAYVMPAAQVAIPYSSKLTLDAGSGYGLAIGKSCTNKLLDATFTGANWTLAAGATRTLGVTDITGFPRAVTIVGDATNGLKAINAPLGLAASSIAVVFAAAASTGTPSLDVKIRDSGGTLKGTGTVVLSTTMQRFAIVIAGWDGATATGQIEFVSNAGALTYTLSAVLCVALGTDVPALLPLPNATHGDYNATAAITLPVQWNSEGEIIAQGIGMIDSPTPAVGSIVTVKNGANDKNRRELQIRSGVNGFRFAHYDSTPTAVNADTGYTTYSSRVWKARGRSCRVQLLDNVGTTPFTTIGWTDDTHGTITQAQGRTAIWTLDTTQSTSIQLGAGTAAPSDVILRNVVLQTREEKLA